MSRKRTLYRTSLHFSLRQQEEKHIFNLYLLTWVFSCACDKPCVCSMCCYARYASMIQQLCCERCQSTQKNKNKNFSVAVNYVLQCMQELWILQAYIQKNTKFTHAWREVKRSFVIFLCKISKLLFYQCNFILGIIFSLYFIGLVLGRLKKSIFFIGFFWRVSFVKMDLLTVHKTVILYQLKKLIYPLQEKQIFSINTAV